MILNPTEVTSDYTKRRKKTAHLSTNIGCFSDDAVKFLTKSGQFSVCTVNEAVVHWNPALSEGKREYVG